VLNKLLVEFNVEEIAKEAENDHANEKASH
jgi:hypothetical protein